MPLKPETIRHAARAAIAALVKQNVSDDECVVSSGSIDSLSVLKLISRLEAALEIRIPKERVQPEDFDSVETIIHTIERVVP
jgi:acyl carrier protein